MSHSQERVLNLDEPLILLALQEALQTLDELRTLLQRHGQSPYLDLCHQAQLRLTYCALRCPELHLQRAEILELHRVSQHHLAHRLQGSPIYQSLIHSQSPS